ncbi:MAG: PaaI family thioesterase [Candidatus Riflebacteria bacterium]|nr:PaaI family thioesterase [Candidatus Riflebacteria bacterium]
MLADKQDLHSTPQSWLKPVKAASSHTGCLLCGSQNPMSMHLQFVADDNRVVHADFQAHDLLQGYQGIIHGGVTCALLDSAMTHCLFNQAIEAVTGEMKVKFVRPVPCRSRLRLRAWLEKAFDPLYVLRAELSCDECLLASAEAKFMRTAGQASS